MGLLNRIHPNPSFPGRPARPNAPSYLVLFPRGDSPTMTSELEETKKSLAEVVDEVLYLENEGAKK